MTSTAFFAAKRVPSTAIAAATTKKNSKNPRVGKSIRFSLRGRAGEEERLPTSESLPFAMNAAESASTLGRSDRQAKDRTRPRWRRLASGKGSTGDRVCIGDRSRSVFATWGWSLAYGGRGAVQGFDPLCDAGRWALCSVILLLLALGSTAALAEEIANQLTIVVFADSQAAGLAPGFHPMPPEHHPS